MSSTPPIEPLEEEKTSLYTVEVDDVKKEEDLKSSYSSDRESQSLHILRDYAGGNVRASSPNAFSEMSIDDRHSLHATRRGSESRNISSSAAPAVGLKGKARAFWARNKGLALVLVAQIFGSLMNMTARLLELEGNHGKGFDPFQILFARMGITVILATLYMWWKGIPHFLLGEPEVRGLLVARGLTGFFGVFGMYFSLQYLPLADATVITFLAPGVSCWACSYILKEPFTRMEQMASLLALSGVVLIARPTSLFSRHDAPPPATGEGEGLPVVPGNTTTTVVLDRFNMDKVSPEKRLLAVAIAMLGVFGAAGAFTTLRWIGKRAHPLISVNYFAAWCTIVSAVMMFVLKDVGLLLPGNLFEWSLLFFMGLSGFIFQFLLAAGLQAEKSSRATNMMYTAMLFALTFDKLIFGTTPTLLSIVGSSLILGSAIYVAMHRESSKVADPLDGGLPIASTGEEELGLVNAFEMEEEEEEAVNEESDEQRP
ncbi:hypothetical protein FKW77_007055 [Venturia effusa]|uniref:EamA domain-containing protein n=1 Tax=Venturia effusa TaxID=50376 RepID=A0A517LLR9_9PEZI|nr:hypothetical protein FKW77_007055 [Venturia effusa]